MALQALRLPPGVVRSGTDGSVPGRYWDANLVRWRSGALQPVGGWQRATSTPMTAAARRMHCWRLLDDRRLVAIGTDTTLLISSSGEVTDHTPADFVPLPGVTGEGGYGTGRYNIWDYDAPRPADEVGVNPYARQPIWTFDSFGQDLMAVASSDGRLLHLAPGEGGAFPAEAEVIANAPIGNRGVLVTEERHVMLFGAEGNPRRIAWCSREDYNDWNFADPDNSAGFFDLNTPGAIVNSTKVRGGILIWTDSELWLCRYVGAPFFYGFERVGESCALLSPYGFATFAGTAVWMGREGFWRFDGGSVRTLPCDVADFVFQGLDPVYSAGQAFGAANGLFPEVWFFYPDKAHNGTPNRYVAFSYEEGWWTIGALERTAMLEAGVFPYPQMGGADRHLYQHEDGLTAAGATRVGSVWAETGALSLPPSGDGILNITAAQMDSGSGYDATRFRAFCRFTREGAETETPVYRPNVSGYTDTRFAGRDIRLRIEAAKDTRWTIGQMRFDVKARGKR
jgi:hypothetical protein